MEALFIGQTYIDVTLVADAIPTGDDKAVAKDYAVSFGGNAVTAAFAAAKLGVSPDLLTSLAHDWLGRMFSDMAVRYGVFIHPRPVKRSSLSFVIPNNGKRAILRARDDDYLHPFPTLNLAGCRILHLDGHQPDAAIAYARACREAGIPTSLDGGGLRSNTHDLLEFIDIAVVAERLCEQMELTPTEMLTYLHARGCRIGAVTLGERGLIWIDEKAEKREMPALRVPASRVIDTNGAGDIFHGAYLTSYLAHPEAGWDEHFRFARAASAHSVQKLGNEASLPTLADIAKVRAEFEPT
ncbi:sugar kinase [Phreatobacter stygius]|uniref:Sugar kinase n=1 Tax=Phreatobacter stygius TaxID=1940610 RepID=A0A4D7ATE6_9HYPH|nr:sugar kinase [Phreatobacter stygius]QCI64199.1 sugar kinase [Phreatobacter stygius]